MNQFNFDSFFDRIDHYHFLITGFALAGVLGYLLLLKEQRKNEVIKLSLSIIVVVAFYEILALVFSSQQIVNRWIYNIFNAHVAAILFVLLIRSFLKMSNHKKIVNRLILLFLLISIFLHLTGIARFNDTGEYFYFFNTVLILSCCGLYFFEFITVNEFLDINPLKEFSFWVSTVILFYFSSTFMIYISFKYLYTNHLNIYYMVIEIPKNMALLCNLLLCLGIYSLVIKNRFKKEIIHV